MQLMPSRYEDVRRAVEGYQATGVPLVAVDGNRYYPAGIGDDPGLFDLVPRIAHLLGVHVNAAIDVMLLGALLAATAAALVGWLRLLDSVQAKIWAVAAVFVASLVSLRHGDVYVVGGALTLAFVPWWLMFLRDRLGPWGAWALAGITGFTAGLAEYVRSQSSVPLLVLVTLILADRLRLRAERRRVLVALCLAAVGLTAVAAYRHTALSRRDAFLERRVAGYEPPAEGHARWHSVFIGLGFLQNPYGIRYLDEVAFARVRELDPQAGRLTRRYEEVLRREVLRIVRQDPAFVVRTVAAKGGVLLLYVLLFANLGLAVIPRVGRWPRGGAHVLVAMAAASLPGLLVMPYLKYSLPLAALAASFSVLGGDELLRALDPASVPGRSTPSRPGPSEAEAACTRRPAA